MLPFKHLAGNALIAKDLFIGLSLISIILETN